MFFLKKNYIFLIILIILLIALIYVTNITSIPNSIILFQNQDINLRTVAGLKLEETVQVGANISSYSDNSNLESFNKEKKYNLSLLGINLRTITANIIPNTKVVPLGNLIGMKLYTKGVLVIGTSEIKGEDEKVYKPYENAGIEEGDSIIKINDEEVNTSEKLITCVSKCRGKEIKVTYQKGEKILETKLTPVKTSKNTYKIGLWVRDAAAGIGTVTFYDKNTSSFVALGHGIQDIDTEKLVEISSGEFVTADILDIEKGEENNPGKIEGTIEDGKVIGKIYNNTGYGVYGYSKNIDVLDINNIKEIEVASRNEIKIGKASIICTLDNEARKEYEIEIEKIYLNNNKDNKSMLIKVTDEELLNKTGGIIQGMSGSPIIQNGKFIGALTHVLVSNPTKRIWSIWRLDDKKNSRSKVNLGKILGTPSKNI